IKRETGHRAEISIQPCGLGKTRGRGSCGTLCLTLIGKVKERFIPPDWSTRRYAPIIICQVRLRLCIFVEEIARRQSCYLVKLPGRPVKLIRAATCKYVDYGAAHSAELSAITVGGDVDLFHVFGGWEIDTQTETVIDVVDPIDHGVIGGERLSVC